MQPNQLIASGPRTLRRCPLRRTASGILRDPSDNKIYLAVLGERNKTLLFPVLEDRTVSKAADRIVLFPDQNKIFEVLDPASIGFSTITWAR